MTSELKPINASAFARNVGELLTRGLGTKPELKWLPIAALRIDPSYQREVMETGAANIGRIVREFAWHKFGSITVAALPDGNYAIVDGQHRTLAATLRGVLEVPCLIITADHEQQAEAFAAINGGVTAISPLAIFAAEVESGDKDAISLRDACAKAGVSILRYQIPTAKMGLGQTIAIGALWSAYRTYGPEHLTLGLQCITRTGSGNIGMVRPAVIQAVCHVLEAEPAWGKPWSRLCSVLDEFDFVAEFEQAETEGRAKKMAAAAALTMRLFGFLDAELGR